ncbi:Crp/Fnr family transcriptional regulator [Alteripontixanthobacter maritimus]|uniref:Crp/Fnr family transcriptional regulator n=1 Tax=Alteripontixanthobacter maritimus TaxID=2161824 RepID=UPI001E35BDE7|nr:Crp/Fnr family transcriptional regulator [Alteripontixanthobacter maritimus]
MSEVEISQYPLSGRFLSGRFRHAMSEHEKAVLESLFYEVAEYDTDHEILRRGTSCDFSTMLVDGFAMRTIYQNDKRYIVGAQVPGDFIDLHAFALKRLDHNLVTNGPAKVAYVKHTRLREVMETEPHLARMFWFSTLLDAAIHREWILKLQQLKAERRVAHLMCELWYRLDLVEMGLPDGFQSPMTQVDLADSCGTTAIHMNRALRDLKKQGLVEFRRGRVLCEDRRALERHSQFDPTYLYGKGDLYIGRDFENDGDGS